jgi:hypothetical protein
MGTIVELTNVKDAPSVNIGSHLPEPMRIGDTITTRFGITQRKDGRTFRLDFNGVLRVINVTFNLGPAGGSQILRVETVGTPPTWQAIKTPPTRVLPPAKFPPTKV